MQGERVRRAGGRGEDPAVVQTAEGIPRSGFFHLGTHRLEVVGRGKDRKQRHQDATQDQETAQRLPFAAYAFGGCSAPYPNGREHQEQPKQVKGQFHRGVALSNP